MVYASLELASIQRYANMNGLIIKFNGVYAYQIEAIGGSLLLDNMTFHALRAIAHCFNGIQNCNNDWC